jgi:hypothetical protein
LQLFVNLVLPTLVIMALLVADPSEENDYARDDAP